MKILGTMIRTIRIGSLTNSARLFLAAEDMPKIQWERLISEQDLFALAEWKAQDPDVPDGDWYKDFGTFKLCGTARFANTFLLAGQVARGIRI